MEVEQIAKAASQPISKFAARIKGKAPYSYEMKKRVKDGKCVFLENDQCSIYSLRPLICRFYPFELKLLTRQKFKFLFTEECLGINKGQKLSASYFKRLLRLAKTKQKEDSNRKNT
jgi:Fe-S-cluster containining protein